MKFSLRWGPLLRGLLFLGGVVPSLAFAWGGDGHRIIAAVAYSQLTEPARIHLHALVPGSDLTDQATWLDENRLALMRSVPGSDQWHYEGIPVCGNHPPACAQGACAAPQLERWIRVLSDTSQPKETRVFALRVVVHLVGDIHQPLHAADDGDRGGNDVRIGSYSLHGEWDSGLVKRLFRGASWQQYAENLSARILGGNVRQGWDQGRPDDWLRESNALAKRVAYGLLPGFSCGAPYPGISRLPKEYVDRALPVVDEQLGKAGTRLAWVLNSVLR